MAMAENKSVNMPNNEKPDRDSSYETSLRAAQMLGTSKDGEATKSEKGRHDVSPKSMDSV